ncbi:MAG: HD domain-containing protein [Desulfatiglandaceae bacterium]
MKHTLKLNGDYKRIWELAQPYLNTRKNDIHTAISTAFAFRLLEMEGGDEDIVIPAILLHDVGWKKVPENMQLKAFGPHATEPEWNRVHEVEGGKIAGKILASIDYPKDETLEIQEIIVGHDSRKEAVSHNDMLVKDADKLWRYSQAAVGINGNRFDLTLEQSVERLRRKLDLWLLSESAKKIAHHEIQERMNELAEGNL